MTIRVPNATGSDMSAYLAVPKAGRGAGVVVLQEIFGVTASMKKICDFLATRQFTAICPDLYWSVEPDASIAESDAEKGRALRGKVSDEAVVKDVGAAIEFLRKHPACTGSVGVVGYCWGGMLSFLTAATQKPDAAVCYYGVGIEKHLDKVDQISCPILLHYAGKDTYAGPDVAAQVKTALKGKSATVWEYPQAGHAFARPGGAHFEPRSADVADMRTLSFFVETLIGHRKD
ncbi:MAG: dienelactone hydrolase family protein [Acidobacteriota bacterium]